MKNVEVAFLQADVTRDWVTNKANIATSIQAMPNSVDKVNKQLDFVSYFPSSDVNGIKRALNQAIAYAEKLPDQQRKDGLQAIQDTVNGMLQGTKYNFLDAQSMLSQMKAALSPKKSASRPFSDANRSFVNLNSYIPPQLIS